MRESSKHLYACKRKRAQVDVDNDTWQRGNEAGGRVGETGRKRHHHAKGPHINFKMQCRRCVMIDLSSPRGSSIMSDMSKM